MRVPVYLVCAALVVAVQSEERSNENYIGRILDPAERVSDQEAVRYFLPKLTAKYRQNAEWNSIEQPRYYGYSDMDSNDIDNQMQLSNNLKHKRFQYRSADSGTKPAYSIVAPIHVLREQLNRQNLMGQVARNREFFRNLEV